MSIAHCRSSLLDLCSISVFCTVTLSVRTRMYEEYLRVHLLLHTSIYILLVHLYTVREHILYSYLNAFCERHSDETAGACRGRWRGRQRRGLRAVRGMDFRVPL